MPSQAGPPCHALGVGAQEVRTPSTAQELPALSERTAASAHDKRAAVSEPSPSEAAIHGYVQQ